MSKSVEEVKIELLNIALQLAVAVVQSKDAKTPSSPTTRHPEKDAALIFSDCVDAVQKGFSALTTQ